MSLNKIILIHGYNGDTSETFGPYLEQASQQRHLEFIAPIFPAREQASHERWAAILDDYLDQIDQQTIVVAHSLGTLFVPRYLAGKQRSIGLYVSLAGFLTDHSGRADLQTTVTDFLPNPEQIKQSISLMENRVAIYSDNDHLNPRSELEHYADVFQAQRVFLPGQGHFGHQSGVKEIPELVAIIDQYR